MIQLLITDQAEKQLAKLDKSVRLRIIASLDRLREAYPVGDLRKMQEAAGERHEKLTTNIWKTKKFIPSRHWKIKSRVKW